MTRSAPISESQEPMQRSLPWPVAPTQRPSLLLVPQNLGKEARLAPHGSLFRFIGLAVAGVLGLGTAWLLNSYFYGGDKGKKEVAQAEHNQSARKSEEVKSVVDKGAQSTASRSPGRRNLQGKPACRCWSEAVILPRLRLDEAGDRSKTIGRYPGNC